MTVRKTAFLSVFILLAGIFAVLFNFQKTDSVKLDPVAVNDITQTLAEQWDTLGNSSLPCRSYGLDYVVLDNDGKPVAETKDGLDDTIAEAVVNRDTIVDISQDGHHYGKLIIYNTTGAQWEKYRKRLVMICIGTLCCLILFIILYSLYLDHSIFQPFRKLKAFAGRVAEGNFDIPLKMDRGNLFGAFTESFDLMRNELEKARESERLANESKKELVASLSHDIKTPVASIKAVSEIMMVKTDNENVKRQLAIIDSKADQINALITNLFNATLEELQRLRVVVSKQSSSLLLELIQNADYNESTVISPIPDCEISADPQRLQQVIDNIISNSYKYAGTSINVSFTLREQFLEVEFRDYGRGVTPDELPLLFHKYYRAANGSGKSGAGLGLYISKYLMNKMGGGIACRNTEDGFAVTIKLPIAKKI